ncbi:hypothetical protein M5C99_07360 [Acidovorax sp. NCPPB 2350]|nr:hypothetical protein M5C99_07360 [Acidovorax sp. NCPPB 2350]
MFGLSKLTRKIGSPGSSPERQGEAGTSPARTSRHRPASPSGMPAPRQAAAQPEARQVFQPRVDIRGEHARRTQLDWNVASRLYDPRVLNAERLKVQDELFNRDGAGGLTVVLNPKEVQAKIAENMKARANAHNYSSGEVRQRLDADPGLKAEFDAVFRQLNLIPGGGMVSFRPFEIMHIASENLAARQQDAPRTAFDPQAGATHQPERPGREAGGSRVPPAARFVSSPERRAEVFGHREERRPSVPSPTVGAGMARPRADNVPMARPKVSGGEAGPSHSPVVEQRPGKEPVRSASPEVPGPVPGWRTAQSRRTRPSHSVSMAPPVQTAPAEAANAAPRPALTRSNQFQGPRFNPAFASVRPQGSPEAASAPPGAGRRVRFAEYAVKEGIAERTDGTKPRPARLPVEQRDQSLSEINQQIRSNMILKSQGMLPLDEEEGQTSAPVDAPAVSRPGPLTLEDFGFSIEEGVSDAETAHEATVEISEEDRETIATRLENFRPIAPR